MNNKRQLISLIIGFAGVMLGLYGVVSFNQFVLMSLPLAGRMIVMPVVYWLIALIPIILMVVDKDKLKNYGFSGKKIGRQIITGLLLGMTMSLILTVVPHAVGFGEWVDNGKRYQYLWQFAYECLYCILAIGCVEEFVFRGFIFEKIRRISGQNRVIAIIGSSIIFGLFHLFAGNMIQMIMTAFIGALFCICREKIKNCSTLSLILAHGLYDALITVWACVFL